MALVLDFEILQLDIKYCILQPIGEAQISKKRPHIKRIRIIQTKTSVQISKKVRIRN